jgi:5-methylcytosine-specific restriction endonuclease McrA
MPNYAFVIDTNKRPLDPIHPAHARKLLWDGKAAVFRRYPFTIILKHAVDVTPAPVTVKIDPGSKVTGIALLKGDKLIFAAELTHRGQAIKASLDSRRAIRRSRRARHTRYRQARFLNRTRQSGWLAPSLQHRVDTTLTWVSKFIKFAPVNSLSMELVRFDLQQLENPDISGIEYQQGELIGYEVREYLLNKWDRKCAYCKVGNVPLQVEHIQPKAKGGTNRISNLCLACEKCNQKKGTQDIKNFLSEQPDLLKQIQSQAKRPLKDAAAVNSTRWALFNALKLTELPIETGSGGLTKYNRTRLELPCLGRFHGRETRPERLRKTHYLDAACVGKIDKLIILTTQPLLIKSNGHGTRQMCRTDKFGFPSRSVPRDKFVKGFQTGDIVKAIVTSGKKIGEYVGRVAVRTSGSFNISAKELVQGIGHKYCQILHRKDGYSYSVLIV